MNTDEMVTTLKEKGYEIEEPERILKVKFSDRDNVLLEDENCNILIESWRKDKKDLNDFNYLEENDYGQFWINGKFNKFEFYYKGKWLVCDDIMEVRFLK